MLATLRTLLARPSAGSEPRDGAVRSEWEALLVGASSSAERDEINDIFGRAAA